MKIPFLLMAYKVSHSKQYPPGTAEVYSYFESRPGAVYGYTTFFGLQYLLREYFAGVVVTQQDIDEAVNYMSAHLSPTAFNKEGWQHIVDVHGGRLPVEIMAVDEGTSVPFSNVLMTIRNTDPECFWLTNWLETMLVQVWYPSTVATISRYVKKDILAGLVKTGTPEEVDFKLHDFGFRGVSSLESAALGGAAHLVNFKGTDTMPALYLVKNAYDFADMPGFSIPASEHSTMTSWSEEGEVDAMRNMLRTYPEGLVACVSDSWDIERACSDIWGTTLREEVLSRNGTLVVRPDSGKIVPMVLNVITRLMHKFGFTLNSKGYKVLPPQVRVIQGDGCTPETISEVIHAMIKNGFSLDNIAFGMGGGLLQKCDRDTQRFAFKASSVVIDGEQVDVYKRPASDPTKNSKRGKLALIHRDDEYQTIFLENLGDEENHLKVRFRNGELLNEQSFGEIRDLAAL